MDSVNKIISRHTLRPQAMDYNKHGVFKTLTIPHLWDTPESQITSATPILNIFKL